MRPWENPRMSSDSMADEHRDEAMRWFYEFVRTSRWRFAKTYVETYPHEYTLERWGDAAALSRAVQCIERWGVVEPFWSARRKYLHLDGRKYWHMGDAASGKPEERPTLINRSWLDVGRYREDARALGYDDESLDRLTARWEVLLEKARRAT
jgi:hypothetical protein